VYFPDVNIFDGASAIRRVAPSVAVLGAFALNDSVGYPWFAPAGFVRGSMASVSSVSADLTDADADTLYAVNINPILARRGSIVVFGQKTLQRASTALDRVNVRRLLISMRRTVRQISNGFLFEPNNSDTLDAFRGRVTAALSNIQQQRGVDRFTVVIDTSTTTQADIENNTIRGQIYLKPTRSIEFVSLSFELNNVITA
jgi:phage tail sheath protein FI